MDVNPLTGVLGAEVVGADLTTELDAQMPVIRQAILDHQVIAIRGQSLSAAQQVAVSHWLGDYSPVPFISGMADAPEVIRVLKEKTEAEAFNFGGAWHSDFSFMPQPPAYTILHAVDLPPYGGDTGFASMYAAFDALGADMQERLRRVTALHSASHAYAPEWQWLHDGLGHMTIICDETANDVTAHPLVTTHPETGRTVLFFNVTYVRGLRGESVDEAEVPALLAQLHNHSTQFAFTYRHRWQPGDVVIWDNRCTQHFAVNDYGGFRRELHRTTVAGGSPSR